MTRKIKVIAERSIPYLSHCIDDFADLIYLDNAEINRVSVASADALIVRSITKCNEALLRDTLVRFVATATSGIDHIDADYCERQGIVWQSAAGCNAIAVAQYVFACLSYLSIERGVSLQGKTIGIIGVGHVGKQVERIARACGLIPLLYDPPRAEQEGEEAFVSLSQIQEQSDIITLHVPLTPQTKHLVDRDFVHACVRQPILINACRGAVCDSEALLMARCNGLLSSLVLDCWEGEPHIRQDLLAVSDLASPHIAGFSADGKHRGSRMALQVLACYFGWAIGQDLLDPTELPIPQEPIDLSIYPEEEQIARAFLATLNPKEVDTLLRQDGIGFEILRRTYHYPREMAAHRVVGATASVATQLRAVGFVVEP